MELRDLRLVLRRYWLLVLGVFAACLLIGLVSAYLPAKTYRTDASLFVQPDPDRQVTGPIDRDLDYFLPIVLEELRGPGFRARVAETLPSGTAQEPVSIIPSIDTGTPIIRIVVEGKTPEALAAWANASAALIVREGTERFTDLIVVEQLQPAFIPGSAIAPQPGPILFGTIVLGIFAGLLAGVLASRVRQVLDVAEEVRTRLGAPVLAQIPPVRRLQKGNETVAALLADGPPELVEAFQSLRTNVSLALLDDQMGVVAVASWAPGEGKSTVAAGLALTMASVGHEVIVIDADLRRPTQHLRLGEDFGEGLADLDRVGIDRLLRRTRHAGLSYLPAGIPDRHPADVVAVTLGPAVQHLSAKGRLLVIDAPPIQGVAETPLVLSVAHSVILVIDASSVKLLELEQAIEQLRASGVVLLGVVVNRARRTRQAATYDSYMVRDGIVPRLVNGPGALRPLPPLEERHDPPEEEGPASERPVASTGSSAPPQR